MKKKKKKKKKKSGYLDVSTNTSEKRWQRSILFVATLGSLTTATSGLFTPIIEVVVLLVVVRSARELGIVVRYVLLPSSVVPCVSSVVVIHL